MALLAILVAGSGCRVVSPVEEGRKISLNPCELVGLEKVTSLMGQPMFQRLPVSHSPQRGAKFGHCQYEPVAMDESADVSIGLAEETRKRSRGRSNTNFTALQGIGREAGYRLRPDDGRGKRISLIALTDAGAELTIVVGMVDATEGSLLSKAKAIASVAVSAVDEAFPGNQQPPRDEPPVPICSAVGAPAMTEHYRPYWTLPAGLSLTFKEAEYFGGPDRLGSSPVGGGWACLADVDNEVPHPHTVWLISKASPPKEPLAGSIPLDGLGAAASFRVVEEAWYLGAESVVLSVFTAGGRYLEVQVQLDVLDEAAARDVAVKVAGTIVAKLP